MSKTVKYALLAVGAYLAYQWYQKKQAATASAS